MDLYVKQTNEVVGYADVIFEIVHRLEHGVVLNVLLGDVARQRQALNGADRHIDGQLRIDGFATIAKIIL